VMIISVNASMFHEWRRMSQPYNGWQLYLILLVQFMKWSAHRGWRMTTVCRNSHNHPPGLKEFFLAQFKIGGWIDDLRIVQELGFKMGTWMNGSVHWLRSTLHIPQSSKVHHNLASPFTIHRHTSSYALCMWCRSKIIRVSFSPNTGNCTTIATLTTAHHEYLPIQIFGTCIYSCTSKTIPYSETNRFTWTRSNEDWWQWE
jgi:hypothetical protein